MGHCESLLRAPPSKEHSSEPSVPGPAWLIRWGRRFGVDANCNREGLFAPLLSRRGGTAAPALRSGSGPNEASVSAFIIIMTEAVRRSPNLGHSETSALESRRSAVRVGRDMLGALKRGEGGPRGVRERALRNRVP